MFSLAVYRLVGSRCPTRAPRWVRKVVRSNLWIGERCDPSLGRAGQRAITEKSSEIGSSDRRVGRRDLLWFPDPVTLGSGSQVIEVEVRDNSVEVDVESGNTDPNNCARSRRTAEPAYRDVEMAVRSEGHAGRIGQALCD